MRAELANLEQLPAGVLSVTVECAESPTRTLHFRDMPAEPTDCELTALWTWEQTAEDRAGIAEWRAERAGVAARLAHGRAIAETDTRNERRAS